MRQAHPSTTTTAPARTFSSVNTPSPTTRQGQVVRLAKSGQPIRVVQDLVASPAYAPLLVNVNHRKGNPDVINFDSSRWYGLPGYYVQKLFSEHRGDVVLPTTVEAGMVNEKPPTGCIGVGTWNTAAEFKDIKVTAPDGKVLFTSSGRDEFHRPRENQGRRGSCPPSRRRRRNRTAGWRLRQTAEREFIRALAGDKS
jgi:hypothetical protein